MGFFKRRTKEEDESKNQKFNDKSTLPELPELPKMNDLSFLSQSSDKPFIKSLPSIEDNTNKNLNQETIKQALGSTGYQSSMSNEIKRPLTKEVDSDNFSYNMPQISPVRRSILQEPFSKKQNTERTSKEERSRSQEPVFVRVDKYKNAIEKVQEIKQKLIETEKVLSDIRELKSKEEFELEEWNKEIQSAKARLDHIDKMLFSELD